MEEPPLQRSSDLLARPQSSSGQGEARPFASEVPPSPKTSVEPSIVKPLQTYQGDIASLVDEKNISVVSIAAAEANRRGAKPLQTDQAPLNQEGERRLGKTPLVAAGCIMLAAAAGVGFYIYARMQPVEPDARAQAPFMLVDDVLTVEVRPGDSRGEYLRALVAARNQVSLSLGLMARLLVVKPSVAGDGSVQEVGAPEFLQALAPNVPAELVRTLEPQMLLGVHSYDENQAFMILKADSYETAYAGLLAWEVSMRSDLAPLFTRTPAVRPRPPVSDPVAPLNASGTVATTTTATTTAAATTSPAGSAAPAPSFFQGNFIDHVVENRDSRAVLNEDGDVLLLWTFLDRSTVVVATNASTLREVISRLSQASAVSLPAVK